MNVNQLTLSGIIKRVSNLQSPAGIPHWKIMLEHQSQRYEADLLRNVYVQIQVVLSGERFTSIAKNLKVGTEIHVEGFIALQTGRNGVNRTVIHADNVELKT
ncbi:primosomal replication protein N [Parashewanella spongiae]|uniref:Replication restart protein PriB n=1 Tax=Parashewanella spongiae TaxID=342950 RepID=A0A3A6TTQ8_9GAMM|nr:primosomal replication protein N [Parashewanella spongiae]MCL1078517.1 primosomal replication protein N [Parashewanella spongiae]RJY14691.1 primosomal replication protein N [Parashewanella spongiae]